MMMIILDEMVVSERVRNMECMGLISRKLWSRSETRL